MSSVVFNSSLTSMVLARRQCSCMQTIAQDKTKRHSSITLSFLVGHTKFAPDWCFGLFKQQYRRTKVSTLRAVAQVVNDSADCNFSQLVSTHGCFDAAL